MVYNRITWAPAKLREVGIKVVEHDGWKNRGLSTASSFDPGHVVWHHDASAPGDSPGVPDYMIRNFATAGAQIWVDRAGTWHFIAAGRAAHAGKTRNAVTNYNSIGIETDHTTSEDWPAKQLDSLRLGTAVLLEHMNTNAANGLHFHKSICLPVGRKVDPDGLDLAAERKRVIAARATIPKERAKAEKAKAKAKAKAKPETPKVSLRRMAKASSRAGWAQAFVQPKTTAQVKIVKEALAAEGVKTYKGWQKKAGLKAAECDGIPDKASLVKLGKRHGFKVVA